MVSIAFVASLGLVVAGVALFSVPAAFVVAGMLLCALTVLHERGGE